MRLFHIDKPGCHSMPEIMPGIKAVYQMGVEFFPYLTVEFLPHLDQPAGVILQTKHGTIRKYYTFDNPKDIEDLRKLIWENLLKEQKIVDITDEEGCLTDFRKDGVNKVITGWHNVSHNEGKDRCCLMIKHAVTSALVRNGILHDIYRFSHKDIQDRKLCKWNRGQECGNNYPPNSATYDLCMDEVNWLCDNGYPVNARVNAMNNLVKTTRRDIYNYLDKHDMKVNKKKFDEIIDAGLFDDLDRSLGNHAKNYTNISEAVDSLFTEKGYYLGLIEDFAGGDNNNNGMILVCLLVIICVLYGWYKIDIRKH